MYWASRLRIVSRMPPTSPAATRFWNSSSKVSGNRLSASANVEPDSTASLIVVSCCRKVAFVACWLWISRHCTSGSPESIIVANCRVKMTRSLVETLGLRNFGTGMLMAPGFAGACWTFSAVAMETPSADLRETAWRSYYKSVARGGADDLFDRREADLQL